MAKIIGMPWDFSSLMNEAISCLPERPMTKRTNIWASEIGGDYCSRYLRMHAHKMSNPPNDRSRRKFVSGHIFEWIVQLILTMCGVLKEKQLRGEVQLPGCLMVSGKLDFIAGGDIDWEKARAEVQAMQKLFAVSIGDMPPIVFHAVERVLWRMEQMFTRVPLKEVILECKSVSGFVGELIERTRKPRPRHPFQILHYQLANKMNDGVLLYINKDSFMCYQFDVTPTKDLLRLYKDDVKTMTEFINNSGKNYLKNMPPKAAEVLYYEDEFRFAKNTDVEYSPYLEFLYGYKDFDAFKTRWLKPVSAWNRTFKRCVTGANMTTNNKEVIAGATKAFPEWDKYVQQARKAGAFQKEEKEDEE